MDLSPVPIAFSAFFGLGAYCLLLFAIYRAGGTEAIRRQIPLLTVLFLGVVLAVVLLPVLNAVLGENVVTAILLTTSVALIGYSTLRRRQPGAAPALGMREALAKPGVGWFLAGWAALLIVGTLGLILVTIATR